MTMPNNNNGNPNPHEWQELDDLLKQLPAPPAQVEELLRNFLDQHPDRGQSEVRISLMIDLFLIGPDADHWSKQAEFGLANHLRAAADIWLHKFRAEYDERNPPPATR